MKQVQTAIILSSFYEPCQVAIPAAKRAKGISSYLPEYGWRCLVITRWCSCCYDQPHIPTEDEFVLHDVKSSEDSILKFLSNWETDKPKIIRISPSASGLTKLWWQLGRNATEGDFDSAVHHVPSLREYTECTSSFLRRSQISVFIRKILTAGLVLSPTGCSDGYGPTKSDWGHQVRMLISLTAEALPVHALVVTTPLFSDLLVACNNQLRVPLVVELRDSISRTINLLPGLYKVHARMRVGQWKRALSSADAIVYVTPEEALRDQPLHNGRAVSVIENGFFQGMCQETPSSIENDSKEVERFVIRLGNLPTQDAFSHFETFLAGFRQFITLSELSYSKVAFEYFGGNYNAVLDLIQSFALDSYGSANPTVSWDCWVDLVCSSTVIVLPQAGGQGVPGSKFYEYLGASKPILAIGEDEYVTRVLKKTNAGLSVSSADEVSKVLADWYGRWKQGEDLSACIDHQQISQYSRRAKARTLADLLNKLHAQYQ